MTLLTGCSLGNIAPDECEGDEQCADAFGLGSVCNAGFCSQSAVCDTGHDCRRIFDGGACVSRVCVQKLPLNAACTLFEPPDLPARKLVGPNAPLIIGNLASVGVSPGSADEPDTAFDFALTTAVRLAVREVNDISGLNDGRPLGLVVCNNAGFNNSAVDDERRAYNDAALDYLSGQLGVPVIVGPTTSTDSLSNINHALERRYPTAFISPSATSPQLSKTDDRLDAKDPVGLFWRTAPSDELQGGVIATDVVGKLPTATPIAKVAALYINDAYGLGLATVFQTRFTQGQTKLFPFDSTDDFQALAAQVAAENHDAVLLIAILAANTVSFIDGMTQTALKDKPIYLTDGSKDASALLDPSLADPLKTIIRDQLVGTAPGTPASPEYNAFAAALAKEFTTEASKFSFLAHAYDATYCGAYGVLYASKEDGDWDGRDVAVGLARLVKGSTQIKIGKNSWESAKTGLTTGEQRVDIVGISGSLEFDVDVGEAPGVIEVWKPRPDLSDFDIVKVVEPPAG